ncbi:MAG: IS91 family transposase [Proteobacteria bacterium]|nr:IS91 family transposase [Pseudomonadota bacterium]
MAAASEASDIELADLFARFGDELSMSPERSRVAQNIVRCRTAALGGHINACDECEHEEISYNSCRDRHCPKCGGLQQARWVEARRDELLPVEYFHVVFTIPDVLHPLFLANPRTAYGLLFSAVATTLKEVALNPVRLGAKIGWTAVLHTWTQKLLYHPHVHCIVPGGGLSVDGERWVSCKPGFLLPVKVLSTVFRGVLLRKLERALDKEKLKAPRGWSSLRLQAAASKKWTVYAKRPFAGPEQVLTYVGRYTHRVALSNRRLVALDSRRVTLTWRDRADHNRRKLLVLDAAELLRRFLLHVLPRGFMRIRHYGFLASSVRRKSLALCRRLLEVPGKEGDGLTEPESWQELLLRLTGVDVTRCPCCKSGRMVCRSALPALSLSGARGRASP